MTLEFQLLGTMLISGRPAEELLPGARARQLLATLLQHPNRFVGFDTIADNLWEDSPPKSASANLRTHVGAVRRAIAEADLSATVQTRPGGYQIRVQPQLIDTSRMDELLVEARHLVATHHHEDALALVDDALSLWRGSPFEDLPVCSAWLPQITRWEMLHAEVLDLAIRLQVQHGDPWRAAAMVRRRLEADRYDEAAWCQLVRCCLAGGMVSQAVQALHDVRRVLADELGIEPGPELLELEQQVRDDPNESGLTLTPPDLGRRTPGRSVPCQLPHDLPDFSGRTEEIEQAVSLFARRPDDRPAVLIVTGPPGVGKTAFVTHVAHRLRDDYPGGQVYLDLRGTTTPLSAPFAVTEVLSAIGISNPSDELGRAAALLRSELANRRLLLVVDNAATSEQLTPLLPGTGDSAVLVTSRRRLTDVVGAVVLDLDVLEPDDAAEMVNRVAGIDDAEEQRLLAEACGGHPLAIRIAGGRLLRRPDLSVRALAARVTDPGRALDELTLGEIAFRSSAQLSCSALHDRTAQGFRTLGALALSEFGGLTVEAATGGPDGVDSLLEENLLRVDRSAGGQVSFVMHDLLRWHAREWSDSLGEKASDNVRDLLGIWLTLSHRAAGRLPSYYFGPQPDIPAVDLDPGWLEVVDEAPGQWFDNERQRLDGMLASAIEFGHDDLAWKLAVSWSPYFDLRGHTRGWFSALDKVLQSVRRSGDRIGEATVLRDLGQVALYRDDLEQGADLMERSRDLFLAEDDFKGAGFATIGLISAEDWQDAVGDQTLVRCAQARDWFTRAEYVPGLAAAHSATALVFARAERWDEAGPWVDSALALAQETGDSHRYAKILRRSSELHEGRGDLSRAQQCLEEALETFLALGDHRCAGYTSTRLGQLMLAGGDSSGARRRFREALDAGRRLADPAAQAAAWDAMADALLESDSPTQAAGCLQRSIRAWQVADRPKKAAEAGARLAEVQAQPTS